MTIRKAAKDWLVANRPEFDGAFHASRIYPPSESWTGSSAWAFNVPFREFEETCGGVISLLCETNGDSEEFFCLGVPTSVFRACHHLFYSREDIEALSLFLSAEEHTRFREVRGDGKIELSSFLVTRRTTRKQT